MNKGQFILKNTDFKVGELELEIDTKNSIITNLSIKGDQETYNKLTEDESSEWNWTIYPPHIRFWGVPIQLNEDVIELIIDEDMLNEYDITFYMIEHFDFYGKVRIYKDNKVEVDGFVVIAGEENKLYIKTE